MVKSHGPGQLHLSCPRRYGVSSSWPVSVATMTPHQDNVGCLWSPTGDHLFQLVEVQSGGLSTRTVADRCRYCGSFAFPTQRGRDQSHDELGRPAEG